MNLMKRILNKLRRLRATRIKQLAIIRESCKEEQLVLENFPPGAIDELTSVEKRKVDDIWSWTGLAPSYKEQGFFKHYRGFDPCYLTHYQYLPIVAHALNNYHYTRLYDHKGLLDCLANKDCGLRFPKVYCRSISGEWYDGDMRQLGFDAAVMNCAIQEVVIAKDAIDTSGGVSVRKCEREKLSSSEWEEKLRGILSDCKRDIVIQECIQQHPSFARFNPTSINTLRVTTLYLNGRFSPLSIILRMGKEGVKVDNWRNGILVGVELDGRIHELAYDIHLNPFKHSNGVCFKGTVIEQVPSLLEKLAKAHTEQFSLCKFIGWDIAFDANNQPVVIELNSSQPGVIGEQLCTGPIFGDRTDEVISYCKTRMG